jgi:sugar lactone lactonase YvrE
MKKFLSILIIFTAGLGGFCLSLSCSQKSPSSPNNLQTAVSIVSSINPTLTFTPTPSPTNTATVTPTSTITATPTPYESLTSWSGFSTPEAVAAYNDPVKGGLFIADTGHDQVVKYNFNGTIATGWGAGGKGKGKIPFNQPLAVAVDGGGNLYVVGGVPGVNKYDSSGNFLIQFTNVTFTNPQGVAVDGGGNIYVSDTQDERIVKLNSNGGLVTSFGSSGALTILSVGTPVPTAPHGLAVDYNNPANVAVAASDNNIHIYNSVGYPLTTIPTASSVAFDNPRGVAYDTGNNLYVADMGYHQVEEFANYALFASPIVIFNNNGSLVSPTGVAVDSNGNIYVTDAGTGQVIPFTP